MQYIHAVYTCSIYMQYIHAVYTCSIIIHVEKSRAIHTVNETWELAVLGDPVTTRYLGWCSDHQAAQLGGLHTHTHTQTIMQTL